MIFNLEINKNIRIRWTVWLALHENDPDPRLARLPCGAASVSFSSLR